MSDRAVQFGFPSALKYLGESVNVGLALEIDELRIYGLVHLSNTMTFIGHFNEAWKTAQEGLQLAEKVGERLHLSEVLAFPIPVHFMLEGDLTAAYKNAQRASQIAEPIGFGIGDVISNLTAGRVALICGEYETAVTHLRRAVELGNTIGIPIFSAMALSTLGAAYLGISDSFLDEITEVHMQTFQLLQNPIGSAAGGWAWADMGFCVLTRGDLEHSQECFQNGLNNPSLYKVIEKGRLLAGSALVALGHDEPDKATLLIAEARAYVEEYRMKYLYPFVALVEGQTHAARWEMEAALTSFAEAESLARGMNVRPIVWQAQALAAQGLANLGRTDESAAKRHQAQETIGEIAALFQDKELRTLYLENTRKKLDRPDMGLAF